MTILAILYIGGQQVKSGAISIGELSSFLMYTSIGLSLCDFLLNDRSGTRHMLDRVFSGCQVFTLNL